MKNAAIQAKNLGLQMRSSAHHTTNLGYQLNDIGVMLAAGQSPLQLAMQQGTQVSQIFNQMGGGKNALKGLGAAFTSVVNPLSLATLGVIAFGGFAVQWLTGAGEKAKTLEESFEDLTGAVDRFKTASTTAGLSSAKMLDQFGAADPAFRQALVDLAAIEKTRAFEAIDQTAVSLQKLAGSYEASRDMLGLNSLRIKARKLAGHFSQTLRLLKETQQPAEKLKAALDLKAHMVESLGSFKNMNVEQRELFTGLTQVIVQMKMFGAQTSVAAQKLTSIADAERLLGQQMLDSNAKKVLAEHQAETSAELTLQKLKQQVTELSFISQYGQDSVEVARLRLTTSKDTYKVYVEQLTISTALKNELIANHSAAELLKFQISEGAKALSVAEKAARGLTAALSTQQN